MKWLMFVIVAVLAVTLETSNDLLGLIGLHSLGGVYPSVTAVLMVFVALFAPKSTALWAAFGLGLAMDLAPPSSGTSLVVGPHALGYVFGTYFVLQIRTMVFRRRLLTIALLTMMFVLASGVIEVALLTVRSWLHDDAPNVRPMGALMFRVGIGVCSGVLAVPLGWVLVQTLGWWGFQHSGDRRRTWK